MDAIMRTDVEFEKPKIPNTTRFWRLNTIEALKWMLMSVPYPYPDPETMEYYLQKKRELSLLEEQERQVLARYERIKALRIKKDVRFNNNLMRAN